MTSEQMVQVRQMVKSEGYTITGQKDTRRVGIGFSRVHTYDREQNRNDRVNSLYVRYSERLNILRVRIACLMSGNVQTPKQVMKLAARCVELRTRREMVLQGNLPKSQYKLLKVS